jgi:di/tricarboxylate transporter
MQTAQTVLASATLVPMTLEMAIVLGLVAATVILFLTEWLRVDVVAILVMVALPLLGIVDGVDAFRGLASNAVISIIAVIIMGRGLDHTGVISQLMRPLMRLAGRSRGRITVLVSGTVAVVSSFMQNVGAAALFLPAIRRLSRHSGVPVSRLLMPVGFSAILGGTVTLVGSSPLIMLNDLIQPFGLAPFGLFSVTPVGLALVVAGIAFFVFGGQRLLPAGEPTGEQGEDLMAWYCDLGCMHELRAPADLAGELHVQDLIDTYCIQVVALSQKGGRDVLLPPDRAMRIAPGAVLAAIGSPARVAGLVREHGFVVKAGLDVFAQAMSDEESGVVEALVPPHSRFIGMTVADIRFRHNHLMSPLAVTRDNKTRYCDFWDMVVHAGDSILMHGRWESFHAMRPRREILFVQSLDHEVLHPEKAGVAVGAFLLSTGLVLATDLALSVCLMTGALAMVLGRVLTIDEAYRGVDWRTVFLLAGLIPLGVAMERTGAASWMAGHIMALVGQPAPWVFLFVLGALSTAMTLVVSNVGATVLLVPLAVDMATAVGADPRLSALVVALAASNSFLLPTHQVNALNMGPGGYRSLDFVRAGLPVSLLFLAVLTVMVSVFY